MDGYLFDTNTLSALLDPSHPKHADTAAAVAALDSAAPKFVSVVALAELQFGKQLIEAFAGSTPAHLASIISRAQTYAPLEITRHTAAEYGEVEGQTGEALPRQSFWAGSTSLAGELGRSGNRAAASGRRK